MFRNFLAVAAVPAVFLLGGCSHDNPAATETESPSNGMNSPLIAPSDSPVPSQGSIVPSQGSTTASGASSTSTSHIPSAGVATPNTVSSTTGNSTTGGNNNIQNAGSTENVDGSQDSGNKNSNNSANSSNSTSGSPAISIPEATTPSDTRVAELAKETKSTPAKIQKALKEGTLVVGKDYIVRYSAANFTKLPTESYVKNSLKQVSGGNPIAMTRTKTAVVAQYKTFNGKYQYTYVGVDPQKGGYIIVASAYTPENAKRVGEQAVASRK